MSLSIHVCNNPVYWSCSLLHPLLVIASVLRNPRGRKTRVQTFGEKKPHHLETFFICHWLLQKRTFCPGWPLKKTTKYITVHQLVNKYDRPFTDPASMLRECNYLSTRSVKEINYSLALTSISLNEMPLL